MSDLSKAVDYEVTSYSDFLGGKLAVAQPCGFSPPRIGGSLFDFQRQLVL